MSDQVEEAASLAHAEVYEAPRHNHGPRVPTLVWIALLLAAAIGGFYVGHYLVLQPINFGTLGGRTSIRESELDSVVATYVMGDETYEVTAREALFQESSLDAARNADGTYVMPSTESVISAARTAIVMREVDRRGISISDEELATYVSETFGTDDIASLASSYAMDQEVVTARLRESAAMAKLRGEVVTAATEAPSQPAAPADGKSETASADYAAYILALAGDEWDAEHGIWASDEGPYATALKEFDVRSDSATYAAAQTAYNVAYQLHSAEAAAAVTQWTEFVNGLLCEASLAVSSLAS
ncbi:MAG: hypothetical protein QM302_06935 [Acidobacteriota bacterium]|nr:hypothetical protein [Acidobacteriota bacterium]